MTGKVNPDASGKKRGDGKKFVKGDPRAGRPLGAVGKITKEVREIAGNLVEDPEYVAALRVRLVEGTLAPPVEQMLWHYRYGKPKETVELTGAGGGPMQVLNLTTAERVAWLNRLVAKASLPGDEVNDEQIEDDGADAYR